MNVNTSYKVSTDTQVPIAAKAVGEANPSLAKRPSQEADGKELAAKVTLLAPEQAWKENKGVPDSEIPEFHFKCTWFRI